MIQDDDYRIQTSSKFYLFFIFLLWSSIYVVDMKLCYQIQTSSLNYIHFLFSRYYVQVKLLIYQKAVTVFNCRLKD